jgi:hypothetical protein
MWPTLRVRLPGLAAEQHGQQLLGGPQDLDVEVGVTGLHGREIHQEGPRPCVPK